MRYRIRFSRAVVVAVAIIAFAIAWTPPKLQAAATSETWNVAGRIYERVRVLEVTDATVTIAHSGGMSQLSLDTLPEPLQQRFNYNAEKAATWQREAAAGTAATEEIKRRQLRARQDEVRLETARRAAEARAAAMDPGRVEFRPEVDLRPVFVEHNLYLKNQGARPSCSIFAIVSVLEYEYARRFGLNEPLSEEYLIWALQRSRPGTPINDGYHFPEVIEVLRECGIARRSMLPDSFASYLRDENPPIAALDDAVTRRKFRVIWIDVKDALLVEKCVAALNEQIPVILGIRWPPHSTLTRNNLLKDQSPQPGAAHAVTLVGYRSGGSRDDVTFIYRNSYGPQWGLGGCGLMDVSYLQKHLLVALCLIVPTEEAQTGT